MKEDPNSVPIGAGFELRIDGVDDQGGGSLSVCVECEDWDVLGMLGLNIL